MNMQNYTRDDMNTLFWIAHFYAKAVDYRYDQKYLGASIIIEKHPSENGITPLKFAAFRFADRPDWSDSFGMGYLPDNEVDDFIESVRKKINNLDKEMPVIVRSALFEDILKIESV